MEYRFRSAIDGAQRGNTSVYFTAARGLVGPSSFSAEDRVAAAPQLDALVARRQEAAAPETGEERLIGVESLRL